MSSVIPLTGDPFVASTFIVAAPDGARMKHISHLAKAAASEIEPLNTPTPGTMWPQSISPQANPAAYVIPEGE